MNKNIIKDKRSMKIENRSSTNKKYKIMKLPNDIPELITEVNKLPIIFDTV